MLKLNVQAMSNLTGIFKVSKQTLLKKISEGKHEICF